MEYAVWTKGTLVRDKIPVCKRTTLKIKCMKSSPKKLRVFKKGILKRKLLQLQRDKEEADSRAKEEESVGNETNKHDEKITELGKKLENLQKEKHNMFIQLKQILQREKKRQQSLALKKTQEQPRILPDESKYEADKTMSRRITSPAPSRMYNPSTTHGMSSQYSSQISMYKRPEQSMFSYKPTASPPRLNVRDRRNFEPRRGRPAGSSWGAW